jgi:hypothetical protein
MCFKITKTTLVFVGIYVDNLLVTSNNANPIDELSEEMKAFDLEDIGVMRMILSD